MQPICVQRLTTGTIWDPCNLGLKIMTIIIRNRPTHRLFWSQYGPRSQDGPSGRRMAHSPPASPSPPFPPAALLWALLPSFCLASSRSVSCCRAPWPASRCSCSPRVLFPFRFVSPCWPSFLYWLLPGATSIYLHITKSVSGVALRGPPGGDEIAQRALSISQMSATSPTGTARAGGV